MPPCGAALPSPRDAKRHPAVDDGIECGLYQLVMGLKLLITRYCTSTLK